MKVERNCSASWPVSTNSRPTVSSLFANRPEKAISASCTRPCQSRCSSSSSLTPASYFLRSIFSSPSSIYVLGYIRPRREKPCLEVLAGADADGNAFHASTGIEFLWCRGDSSLFGVLRTRVEGFGQMLLWCFLYKSVIKLCNN